MGGSGRVLGEQPFITNVFSSLTAALFGVPLALIVVRRLGLAQAEAVEARATLATTVAGNLASAAPGLHPGPLGDLRDAELRDLDMATRRSHTASPSDLPAALRTLWAQLEIGCELAEAVGALDVSPPRRPGC
ncbi:hypothetical protein ACFVYA_07550 [Amycolatopsis sp. NPDC058278]|uniref:hypothetical protein n=1 Tax=Amycolatopsis sp. NPDC058278 TaxID=3346417 RepID=UPI0036DF4BE9